MKIVSSSSLVKNLKPSLFCGTNHDMRVADLLIAGDDEYLCNSIVTDIDHRQRRRRENNRNFACLSPRSILSRWLSSAKKSKSQKSLVKIDKVERERRRENVDGEFGRERKEQTKCSMKGQTGESSPSVSEELNGDCGIAEMSDRYIKEASFNLGAGFGLVYLVAASTNELSKMVELRTQMEMLLQNVKEELQNRRTDRLSKTSDSIDNLAYSTIDGQESLHTNENVSLQNLTLLENTSDSETPAVCSQSLNCDTTRQERRIKEMDQLEAELEIELERLQLHLDTEVMSEHPKEQRMEMMPFEDIGPEESFSGCAEVVDEPPEDGTREHWLVTPNELERRLQQLVEARQQERIKELEAALECARLRLDEKEREVSLWKDTARLISQHLPDSNY